MTTDISKKYAFDMQMKILTIGDSGVGKTCMLLRFANNTFSPNFITTIGIDFKTKNIIHNDKRIKLQIWDTAGQERFRTITTNYFRGSHGIMLVFDVTDRQTFISVSNWMKQIETLADINVSKLLIGNKCDAPGRTVSFEEAHTLADEYGILYIETSAKMDINIEAAYRKIVEIVYDRNSKKEIALPAKQFINFNKDSNKKIINYC
jgi:Ras-related protein Rab-8A